jgi:hypothetical protein
MEVQVMCKGCACAVTDEHKYCPECGLITDVGQAVKALESIGDEPEDHWSGIVMDSAHPGLGSVTWTITNASSAVDYGIWTLSHTNDGEEDDDTD